MPEQVADIAQGERLTQQRAMELGYIFHASENHNYESIKRDGLLLRATRKGRQRHRVAIHMTYARVAPQALARAVWFVMGTIVSMHSSTSAPSVTTVTNFF